MAEKDRRQPDIMHRIATLIVKNRYFIILLFTGALPVTDGISLGSP